MADYNSQLHDRILPHDDEAERALIGVMLFDPGTIDTVILKVKTDDFYAIAHQLIFSAIKALKEGDTNVDLVTLRTFLKEHNKLDTIGGATYLSKLMDSVVTTANVGYYADIVVGLATRRKMIRIGHEIVKLGYEQNDDIDAYVNEAETMVFEMASEEVAGELVNIEHVVTEVNHYLQEAAAHKNHITGTPSGWKSLDKVTGGFQPGTLNIIAARTGMGKSALVLNCARYIGVDLRKNVAVFGLEMTKRQMALRLLCSDAHVPYTDINKGYWKSEWKDFFFNSSTRFIGSRIFLDDTADANVMDIGAKCRRLKKQEGDLALIIIDYLQLMGSAGRHRHQQNREREVAEISRSLKMLAKQLSVPIIALSQLSRKVEDRPGGSNRPQLADLRESGAIEQDADLVMFIYRPAVYAMRSITDDRVKESGLTREEIIIRERGEDYLRRSQLIIAKNRNGPTIDINLAFDGPTMTFHEMRRMDDFGSQPAGADIDVPPPEEAPMISDETALPPGFDDNDEGMSY